MSATTSASTESKSDITSTSPLVAVLLPVYNGAAHIQRSIDSILKQTYPNIHLVIINDGSTDTTSHILSTFPQSNITILTHTTNHGLITSLQHGISHITSHLHSSYIARMDADDISLSERIQKQVEWMETHKDVDVLGTAVEITKEMDITATSTSASTYTETSITDTSASTSISSSDNISASSSTTFSFTSTIASTCTSASTSTATSTPTSTPSSASTSSTTSTTPRIITLPTTTALTLWSSFFYCPLAHPSVIFRTSIFTSYTYRTSHLHVEDYDLWMRMLLSDVRICSLSQPLVILCKHGENVSTTNRTKQREKSIAVVMEHIQTLSLKDAPIITSSIITGLLYPSQLTSLDDIHHTFILIRALETWTLSHTWLTSSDRTAVMNDCTSRLGELVTIAMRIDGSSHEAQQMFRTWMGRDTKNALAALLGTKR